MIRALLFLAVAAAVWGGAIAATGGFDIQVGPVPLRSRNPVPAFVLAAVCGAASFYRGFPGVRQAIAWWWYSVERRASWFAAATALSAVAVGAIWGTYVAGGPDSYCYVNQAEIFARGDVREIQPIAAQAPWPDAEEAFVPIGHVPSPGAAGAFVPMCAAGYPLLMAAARVLAGRTAMFWIVPLMGGLAVWLTFVLGRRAAGSLAGLLAAVLLTTSPTFLYQIVQPMTDVPAVALWTLALVAALPRREGEPTTTPLVAGLATGAALMVRPNLLPLAAVTGCIACCTRPAHAGGKLLATVSSAASSAPLFAVGVLPFVATIAAIQKAMYGGPLTSGYGDLGSLFGLAHVVPNLQRYPVWLLRTETPFVVLALAGPFALAGRGARRSAWWMLAFAAAVFACYVPYQIFDAWWYLRFVLPAYPPLLVLSSAVFFVALGRFSVRVRAVASAVVTTALVILHLASAVDGSAFRMWQFERRFRDGGEYVAHKLPPDAAVVTVWQSGSVRFYSGRPTMVWGEIAPDWLDRALEFLREQGYRPYLLFERDEEQVFRERFERHSAIGALDWPPMADINRQVRIFDPADRERYRRGEPVYTDRVRTRDP
jgi:Oligosaccharyl transferase STT3 subunit